MAVSLTFTAFSSATSIAPTQTTARPSSTTGRQTVLAMPANARSRAMSAQSSSSSGCTSPGGDAAQKAYSPTGLELPGDGKNLGAKVDPADMQPGDVLIGLHLRSKQTPFAILFGFPSVRREERELREAARETERVFSSFGQTTSR